MFNMLRKISSLFDEGFEIKSIFPGTASATAEQLANEIYLSIARIEKGDFEFADEED